ncbi:MAG: MASE1 domain-containing protein, partial [Nitrospira sp.]|nr:MASE1 domain-containing protein [Nitrospira sp.]
KWLAEVGVVAAIYVITGELGFLMAISPGNVTTVWPPSGIALAAVLLQGYRIWPGIWLGSFLVNSWFFSGLTNPFSITALAASFGIGVGSTLQALLGASLIQRVIGSRHPIDRPQDVFKFVGIEVFSCLVASTFGVTSLSFAGFTSWDAYAYTWWTWYLGDFTGVLIVTPLLLTFSQLPWVRWGPRRLAEAVLVLMLLLITSETIFGEQSQVAVAHYPLEFVLLPLLIWMAFRFGPQGVVLSIMIVSGMSIWGTINGVGPFVRATLNESLMLLQAFVGIVTVTGLVLAAAIMERKRAEEALRTSERRLAGALDIAEAAVISVDENQRIILFDQTAEKIFGYTAQEVLGQPLDLLLPSRFTEVHRQHIHDFSGDAVAARRMGERREVFGRRNDGTEFPAEAAISKLNQEGKITFTAVLRDITERKRAEQKIMSALREKEVLLTEVHHRVKNNLQLISSLLNLQAGSIKDKQVQEMFKESQYRVRTIASMHEKLYRSKELAKIGMAGYIRDLAADLVRSYGNGLGSVALKVNVQDIFLGMDQAIPCGLMINELVLNALKYAFPNGRKGEIRIDLRSDHHDELTLTVSDNGIGLPKDFDMHATESLGLQLVNTFTMQLGGKIELHQEGGTEFKIRFKGGSVKVEVER